MLSKVLVALPPTLASLVLILVVLHPLVAKTPPDFREPVYPTGHDVLIQGAASSNGFAVYNDRGCPFQDAYAAAAITLGPAVSSLAFVDGFWQIPFAFGVLRCLPGDSTPIQFAPVGAELMRKRGLYPQPSSVPSPVVSGYLDEMGREERFDVQFPGRTLSAPRCSKLECEQYTDRIVFQWDPRQKNPSPVWEPAGCLVSSSCAVLQGQPTEDSLARPLILASVFIAVVSLVAPLTGSAFRTRRHRAPVF